MVTLTLIQGVVNTFVVFFARVIGSIVDKTVFRTERGNGPGYFITVIVAQIVLGILASMIVAWFSRRREFRADAGSAHLLGTPSPMVNALRRLGGVEAGALPQSMAGFGITDRSGIMVLFIRPYRTEADRQTWFNDPDIYALIESERVCDVGGAASASSICSGGAPTRRGPGRS